MRVLFGKYIVSTQQFLLYYPNLHWPSNRRSNPEVFIGKGVLKLCSKFTREHPCRRDISIKLQSNFIEITLRHVCSPVNLLHIFRIPFNKNTSGWVRLKQVFGRVSSLKVLCENICQRVIIFNILVQDLTWNTRSQTKLSHICTLVVPDVAASGDTPLENSIFCLTFVEVCTK